MLGVMMIVSAIGVVSADTIFSDNFNDNNLGGWSWTFEHDVGTSNSGTTYDSYYAWVEDDAILYKQISTSGYENINFAYCRRTKDACGDQFRIGWKTGSASSNWGSYTQLESVQTNSWSCVNFNLPSSADDDAISIAFFLDNGEGDIGRIDNVVVTGDEISGCGKCKVEIIDPDAGDYFCNEEVLIDWNATDCASTLYSVLYGGVIVDCNELGDEDWTSLGTTQPATELPWDVSSLSEGNYCVKVENIGCCVNDIEGPICIDCTEPEVDVCVEGCCPEGTESDEWLPETETTIGITYSDPENNCDQACALECMIDWDDGSPLEDCIDEGNTNCWDGTSTDRSCIHQYADDGVYTVTVTVTDCADNEGTDSNEATVENVLPVCSIEVLSSDIVEGMPLDFKGTAWDVVADLEIMTWLWYFDYNSDTATTYTSSYSPSVGYSSVTYEYDEARKL